MRIIEVIVAVRNEENSIKEFVTSLEQVKLKNISLRLYFVEDGSTDGTVKILDDICKKNTQIRFDSITNSLGQGMALSYGIINSSLDSDAVITIDIDGSHPIATLTEMIEKFEQGYEIVQGNRIAYDRKYLYRKIGSKVYFVLFSFFTGVNLYKQNVHFRLMAKSVVNKYKTDNRTWFSVRLKNEYYNNKKVFFIDFVAPEREIGKSKFNFKRLLNFAYLSFLTLTDGGMFSFMNILALTPVVLIFLYVSKYLAILLGVLILINVINYIKIKNTDYLNIVKKKN